MNWWSEVKTSGRAPPLWTLCIWRWSPLGPGSINTCFCHVLCLKQSITSTSLSRDENRRWSACSSSHYCKNLKFPKTCMSGQLCWFNSAAEQMCRRKLLMSAFCLWKLTLDQWNPLFQLVLLPDQNEGKFGVTMSRGLWQQWELIPETSTLPTGPHFGNRRLFILKIHFTQVCSEFIKGCLKSFSLSNIKITPL